MSPSSSVEAFNYLFAFPEGRTDLEEIRDRTCVIEIPDWRIKQAERRHERALQQERNLSEQLSEFDTIATEIRSGHRLGWLSHIARIYFGRFSDLTGIGTPDARLIHILGIDRLSTAIEGLIAVTYRSDVPTVDDVARLAGEGKHINWWLAIVAGLDERWKQNASISEIPQSLLISACAIDLLIPSFRRDDDTAIVEHEWKREALKINPEKIGYAYLKVVEACLYNNRHPVGFHELLNDPDFELIRHKVAFGFLRRFPSAKGHILEQLLNCALRLDAVQLSTLAEEVVRSNPTLDVPSRDLWLAYGYAVSAEPFFEREILGQPESSGVIWAFRDLQWPFDLRQMEFIAGIAAGKFPYVRHPIGVTTGSQNSWDATEFVSKLIDRISTDAREEATDTLDRLANDARLATYLDDVKHALASQLARAREARYRQPNWQETIEALSNGAPANVADLHALSIVNLRDIARGIRSGNTDQYKRFWNEDRYGKIANPKPEESCRDLLVDYLKEKFRALGVVVEPEGHMARDKRADISIAQSGQKVLVEMKRDDHDKVWTAAEEQLDRFYTRDPEASGFGVYGVFWFGEKGHGVYAPPDGMSRPETARDMEAALHLLLPLEKRIRIEVIVFDVSGE